MSSSQCISNNNTSICNRLHSVLSLHNVLYCMGKHDSIITYAIAFKQAKCLFIITYAIAFKQTVNVKASSPYHTLTIHHPQYDWFA